MAISLYKVAKFFMVPTGLWKIPMSKNPSLRKMYSIYGVIMQTNYVLYNLSMIIRIIEMLREDRKELPYTDITLAILILEINLKVMIYVKNKIPQMFFIIMEREEQALASKNAEKKSIYIKYVKYYKIATFWQCFFSAFAISWFILLNLYQKFIQGTRTIEDFMYQLWLPFDKQKFEVIVVFYNVFIACCGFFFNCSTQTTLQTLAVFSTAQLKLFQLKLRKCLERDCMVDDVKDLIREHQFLIEFISKINEAVKYVILFEFALESVNGAGALLQLLMVKEALDVPFSFLYLILLVVNLIVLAWTSNELIIESVMVGDAIYESNWINKSEEIKKLLFIMLMRSQKSLSIDVGPFRPMNTAAALMTMKGSYTYAQFMTHTTK